MGGVNENVLQEVSHTSSGTGPIMSNLEGKAKDNVRITPVTLLLTFDLWLNVSQYQFFSFITDGEAAFAAVSRLWFSQSEAEVFRASDLIDVHLLLILCGQIWDECHYRSASLRDCIKLTQRFLHLKSSFGL